MPHLLKYMEIASIPHPMHTTGFLPLLTSSLFALHLAASFSPSVVPFPIYQAGRHQTMGIFVLAEGRVVCVCFLVLFWLAGWFLFLISLLKQPLMIMTPGAHVLLFMLEVSAL